MTLEKYQIEHLIEWQEFQMKKAKDKVKQAQAKDAAADDSDPDDVLKMLNDM